MAFYQKKTVKSVLPIETNREKIFWPNEGYTKGDLIDYYKSIAHYILPHLKMRPLMLHRYIDGIEGMHFFQKRAPKTSNQKTHTLSIKTKKGVDINYFIIKDIKDLISIVNLGTIDIHLFLSHIPTLKKPDYSIIDLDPQGVDFDVVRKSALKAYEFLNSLNIISYIKTSGKRGLHLYIPLQGKYSYLESANFSKLLATCLSKNLGPIASVERDPEKRKKKIYIDYLQNAFGKTVIAPYSVRGLTLAPVATPLYWDELKADIKPIDFTIKNTLERLREKKDPFEGLYRTQNKLEQILPNLQDILLTKDYHL